MSPDEDNGDMAIGGDVPPRDGISVAMEAVLIVVELVDPADDVDDT